jgi:hypothetical protein
MMHRPVCRDRDFLKSTLGSWRRGAIDMDDVTHPTYPYEYELISAGVMSLVPVQYARNRKSVYPSDNCFPIL